MVAGRAQGGQKGRCTHIYDYIRLHPPELHDNTDESINGLLKGARQSRAKVIGKSKKRTNESASSLHRTPYTTDAVQIPEQATCIRNKTQPYLTSGGFIFQIDKINDLALALAIFLHRDAMVLHGENPPDWATLSDRDLAIHDATITAPRGVAGRIA